MPAQEYECKNCGKKFFECDVFSVRDKEDNIFCERDCLMIYHSSTDEEYNALLDNPSDVECLIKH